MTQGLMVAGVRFAVTCSFARVMPVPLESYDGFACESTLGDVDVQVEVTKLEAPDPNPGRVLFDTPAWKMYRAGGRHRADFGTGIAVWDSAVTRVSVHSWNGIGDERPQKHEIPGPLRYPLDQILLIHYLAKRRGVILHSAGAEIDGRTFLFPGRGGAGKSTLASLLNTHSEITMLSDERMVVRERDGDFWTYGTPWSSKSQIAVNQGAPLAAICFLVHGKENRMTKLSPREAAERILPLASVPWYDEELLTLVLATLDNLVSSTPVFEFALLPTPEVADFVLEFAGRM